MDVRGGGDEAAFWKHKTCLLNCAVCKPLSPTHTLYKCSPAPPLITSPQAYPAERSAVAVRKQNRKKKKNLAPSPAVSLLPPRPWWKYIIPTQQRPLRCLFWADCGSRLCWDVSRDSRGEEKKYISSPRPAVDQFRFRCTSLLCDTHFKHTSDLWHKTHDLFHWTLMIALYDLETVSARGRQEAEVEVAGMKMPLYGE